MSGDKSADDEENVSLTKNLADANLKLIKAMQILETSFNLEATKLIKDAIGKVSNAEAESELEVVAMQSLSELEL